MRSSMSTSDLDRNTLKILQGAHVRDVMRYGDSGPREFPSDIHKPRRVDVNQSQMAVSGR
jgi:hypothetical protein